MKSWFDTFTVALDGGEVSRDLIGAAKASAEMAIGHYRFQHQAKVRDAVEDTFPVLLKFLGEEWNNVWDNFWQQNEISPRSLDFFPEVFVNYFCKTNALLQLKELARFEHDLDIYPWTHGRLDPVENFQIQEDSRIDLGPFELKTYEASVTTLYTDETARALESEQVLLWMKGDAAHFRRMKGWELSVLQNLSKGVEKALEFASDDSEEVKSFFNWLGSSHLVRKAY